MNETQLENLALEWFAENGWQTETGPDIAPDSNRPLRADYRDVLLEETLKRALTRINPGLPAESVDEAIQKLKTVDHPIPVYRNRSFQDRKSTRLNSSHVAISYAVFCLK